MKSMFLTRTLWVNVLSGVLALLSLPSVGQLPPDVLTFVSVVTPILNVVLRRLTTQSATFSGPSGPNTLKSALLVLALGGAVLGSSACAAHLPPIASPQAITAYQNTQMVHALDVLRDAAIAANAQTPPLLATADTRKIVMYHQSALRIIDSRVNGWRDALSAGVEDVIKQLPAQQKQLLSPYVTLLQSLIKEAK